MNLNFLFLDECYNDEMNVSSLSGLLIPANKYIELRNKFFKNLEEAIKPQEGVINLRPPELHGSNLLRDADDKTKLKAFEGITNLIIDNKLEIYRVGYFITKTLKKVFVEDEKLLGLSWYAILTMLQPKLEQEAIIPIMDGMSAHTIYRFSGLIKTLDVCRAAGLEHDLSVRNTENILGEVSMPIVVILYSLKL